MSRELDSYDQQVTAAFRASGGVLESGLDPLTQLNRVLPRGSHGRSIRFPQLSSPRRALRNAGVRLADTVAVEDYER